MDVFEKTSQKRKKTNDNLDKKTTKEPPKKFYRSTRQRRRCVDKALVENVELDYGTLPIRDIILLGLYQERLAKKEATTSETSPNRSDGAFFHEAGANNEEDIFSSEDGRDPDERITSTTSLLNYQSFKNKAPREKWLKQDTELFYEEEVGTAEQDVANIKEDFAVFHCPEQSDGDSDDDLQRWSQYKSDF